MPGKIKGNLSSGKNREASQPRGLNYLLLNESDILAMMMAEYTLANPKIKPIFVLADLWHSSKQHVYDMIHGKGVPSVDAWLEASIALNSDIWFQWISAKTNTLNITRSAVSPSTPGAACPSPGKPRSV
jgi:hypothetical protein